jgi:putative toxin-antitoxin system antitoxin component (TIGR02293 family)
MITNDDYKKVFVLATEVLGNKTKARKWLSAAQFSLGGKAPLDFMETPEGAQEVYKLLGRIDDGALL